MLAWPAADDEYDGEWMHWRRKPPTWSAGEWKEHHYEPSLHESIFGRPARLSPERARKWAKGLAEYYLYGGERSFVGLGAATPAFTNPSAAMPLGISVNEHARMQFVSEHMYKFHLRWPRIDQRMIRPHDLNMYAREYFEGEYDACVALGKIPPSPNPPSPTKPSPVC